MYRGYLADCNRYLVDSNGFPSQDGCDMRKCDMRNDAMRNDEMLRMQAR
jgi:hypothetical protein